MAGRLLVPPTARDCHYFGHIFALKTHAHNPVHLHLTLMPDSHCVCAMPVQAHRESQNPADYAVIEPMEDAASSVPMYERVAETIEFSVHGGLAVSTYAQNGDSSA